MAKRELQLDERDELEVLNMDDAPEEVWAAVAALAEEAPQEPAAAVVAEEAPQEAPTLLVWEAGIPQDVPDDAEAQAREHEWQLEHNPSYAGQFAPKDKGEK